MAPDELVQVQNLETSEVTLRPTLHARRLESLHPASVGRARRRLLRQRQRWRIRRPQNAALTLVGGTASQHQRREGLSSTMHGTLARRCCRYVQLHWASARPPRCARRDRSSRRSAVRLSTASPCFAGPRDRLTGLLPTNRDGKGVCARSADASRRIVNDQRGPHRVC